MRRRFVPPQVSCPHRMLVIPAGRANRRDRARRGRRHRARCRSQPWSARGARSSSCPGSAAPRAGPRRCRCRRPVAGARAAPGSRGGPNTPGPASCISPKPIRLIGFSPRNVVLFIRIGALSTTRSRLYPAELQELKTQALDLCNDAEHGGPILEQTGEHGLAARQLGHHRRKRRQTRGSEPALYSDRVQARRRVHAGIVPADLVTRPPPESGDTDRQSNP